MTKMLRYEDKAYIRQWMNFRKPTIKDMTCAYDSEVGQRMYYIDIPPFRLTLNLNAIEPCLKNL